MQKFGAAYGVRQNAVMRAILAGHSKTEGDAGNISNRTDVNGSAQTAEPGRASHTAKVSGSGSNFARPWAVS